MPMLEGNIDHVIGVDTHRDSHTAAILDRNGGLIAELAVPSNQAGYEHLLDFVAERALGLLERVPGLKQVLTIGPVPEALAAAGAVDVTAVAPWLGPTSWPFALYVLIETPREASFMT